MVGNAYHLQSTKDVEHYFAGIDPHEFYIHLFTVYTWQRVLEQRKVESLFEASEDFEVQDEAKVKKE